jgi:acyl dehydratase
MTTKLQNLAVGQRLGPITLPAIDRLSLALYCGGSNDHNPIHIDPDAARQAGLDDVIAHGMLSMAHVGRLITAHIGKSRVQNFSCRFVGMMQVGDVPVLTGEVTETMSNDGTDYATLSIVLSDNEGTEKVRAKARVLCAEQ